jgi:hypothetical protein
VNYELCRRFIGPYFVTDHVISALKSSSGILLSAKYQRASWEDQITQHLHVFYPENETDFEDMTKPLVFQSFVTRLCWTVSLFWGGIFHIDDVSENGSTIIFR